MMIKLKSLISLKEKLVNEPAHFDSGENLDVRGYQTKHFDICGSATELYTQLNNVTTPGTNEAISQTAEILDKIFEIEKQIVKTDQTTSFDQVEKVSELSVEWSYKIGKLAKHMNSKLLANIKFMTDHMREIFIRYEHK